MFSQRTGWKLAENRFTAALRQARGRGKVTDLTVSNPTTAGFAYEARLIGSLSQIASMIYQPQPKGLLPARRAVARYYADRAAAHGAGPKVDAEQIVLTASTSEAYSFAFRLLCDPGDEVLVAAPSYPLFEFLADLQDVRLARYPLFYDQGWQIDLHALQSAATAKTRAVLLVHPNNPTGSYVRRQEAEQLSALCRERGWALVVDEVFLDFAHDEPGISFAGNTGALTLTLSGLSKICGLPQMKLGWMVVSGPDDAAREAMSRLEVIADTYLSVSTPVQAAAADLLAWRRTFQRQVMRRIEANLHLLDRALEHHPHIGRLAIDAGWYAVLRVPATRSDEDLAIELLQRCAVAVHPGHFFDFPADGYLVISLIAPEPEFASGLERLLDSV